jgi:hypothetical protein
MVAGEGPAVRKTKVSSDPNLDFKFGIAVSTRLPELGAWAVMGRIEAQPVFKFTEGLGLLLKGAGRPIGFPSRKPFVSSPSGFPSTAEPESPSVVPEVMAGRQWEEKEWGGRAEHVERRANQYGGFRSGQMDLRQQGPRARQEGNSGFQRSFEVRGNGFHGAGRFGPRGRGLYNGRGGRSGRGGGGRERNDSRQGGSIAGKL